MMIVIDEVNILNIRQIVTVTLEAEPPKRIVTGSFLFWKTHKQVPAQGKLIIRYIHNIDGKEYTYSLSGPYNLIREDAKRFVADVKNYDPMMISQQFDDIVLKGK